MSRLRGTVRFLPFSRIVLSIGSMAATVLVCAPTTAAGQVFADDLELLWDAGSETRAFAREPLLSSQPRWVDFSFHGRVEAEWILRDDVALRGVAFGRLAPKDSRRTHADVREAYIQIGNGAVVAEVGMNVVFWGVTESRHLVDVVNQIDFLEDLDGEEKLGQLMARVSYDDLSLGLFEAYVMAWSRSARFPGSESRPGVPVVVLYEEETFGPGADPADPDLALRWSHAVGQVDWALTAFRGTSREPELVPVLRDGRAAIRPSYELIHQAGLELQWTGENWLWKVEGLFRDGPLDPFLATTFGFERTFWGALGDADLGFLLEYSYDGRDDLTFTIHDDDVFGGMRLAFNDVGGSEVKGGLLRDLETGSYLVIAEGSRRFGPSWTAGFEVRFFGSEDTADPVHWFRRDDHVQIDVGYHF